MPEPSLWPQREEERAHTCALCPKGTRYTADEIFVVGGMAVCGPHVTDAMRGAEKPKPR